MRLVFGFLLASAFAFGGTPELLSFREITALASTAPESEINLKLQRLLATPVLSNAASEAGVLPHRPDIPKLGPSLRVISWNIARGERVDDIKQLIAAPEAFAKVFDQRGWRSGERAWAEYQLAAFRNADVIVLNEADWGLARTGYRNIAGELAQAASMNYVFAPEFVELDPAVLSEADPQRFAGLHGTAVLTRYRITSVRRVALPACYDWFNTEAREPGVIERGRRWSAKVAFHVEVPREIRRGGRVALIVSLDVPDAPGGVVTVVGTHLETRTTPACRQKQMRAILDRVEEASGLLVLAGDLNTSGSDTSPTTWRRQLIGRLRSRSFWMSRAAGWFWPLALPRFLFYPAAYYKNQYDPTSRDVPVVAENAESGMFRQLQRFRFRDGGAFDFRGDPERTLHDTGKTLANSNQRTGKGFEPTYSVRRNIGPVGRYKLDWIIVRPPVNESYRMAPHNPMTMRELNESVPGGMSDHHAVSVDLPFNEPQEAWARSLQPCSSAPDRSQGTSTCASGASGPSTR